MTTLPDLPARTSLREDVATHIREMIFAGLARPGDILRLAPIADELDVSLTPVREALLVLAQTGWISQEKNRGFRVNRISRQDIEDTYLVHEFTAGELAARAALRITQADLERLNVLDDQINTLSPSNLREAEDLNTEFHQQIYRCTDAARLKWFEAQIDEFVPRHFWSSIPGWFEFNRTGHHPLIEALEAHDPERARAAMRAHLHAAGQLLLEHLEHLVDDHENGTTRARSL
jgi:DNA-binding GntR family transcriptional regulator